MRWSWNAGRIAGIELRLHATFLILLAWAALAAYRDSGSAGGAARGVLFTLALFGSVVLHELGHALTARHYGVQTRDITLLPIGGVARLAHIPKEPRQELLISLAGPVVTLGIIVVLYTALRLFGLPMFAAADDVLNSRGGLLSQLMWANVTLLVFNLLPAFPMDGGRVLRAGLALRMDYTRATGVAARVGKAFANVFRHRRSLLQSVPGADRAVRVAGRGWRGHRGHAAVVAGGRVGRARNDPRRADAHVVGVLTRARLLEVLAKRGRDAMVGEAMDTAFRTAEAQEPLEVALGRLQECRCHTLPVLSDHRLDGVLTLDNVGEFVMIETALRVAPATRSSP